MRHAVFLAALIGAFAALAFDKLVHSRLRTWGATDTEVRRRMPLDDQVEHADLNSTRGITINASADQVWPWIVQMGELPRAGYYSYAWIERLQGLQVENSDWILPEYQRLAVGDALDRKGDMVVKAVEPGSFLVLGPPDSIGWLESTWAFGLYPFEGARTRLVTRVRTRVELPGWANRLRPLLSPLWAVFGAGVFIMERAMLRGIKSRAESASPIDDQPR